MRSLFALRYLRARGATAAEWCAVLGGAKESARENDRLFHDVLRELVRKGRVLRLHVLVDHLLQFRTHTTNSCTICFSGFSRVTVAIQGAFLSIWCNVGAMLVQCGAMWVQCGCNVGTMWVQCRYNVGTMWVQCGRNVGTMWVQCGCNVGTMWMQCGTIVGQKA